MVFLEISRFDSSWLVTCRGEFRTWSRIVNFLFLQKSSILNVWLGSEYVSDFLQLTIWNLHRELTQREKINSEQEFLKIKSWLLLIFSTCLHNQLKYKIYKAIHWVDIKMMAASFSNFHGKMWKTLPGRSSILKSIESFYVPLKSGTRDF